ncbi:MAG: dihydroneopterin aldolase [Kiloniellales bacterium]
MAESDAQPSLTGGSPPESGDPAPELLVATQSIRLADLTLFCRIGVTEAERAQRQRLRIAVDLQVEPELPRHDRITEVVDYGALVAKIRDVCATVEFRLVESLAARIAAACFFDPRIVLVQVCVQKLDRYPDVGGIGCEITYRRKPA